MSDGMVYGLTSDDERHLWGPDVTGLTVDDLTEEIEVGERVSWHLFTEHLVTIYSSAEDRERSMTLVLIGRTFPRAA